jgi:NADPH:quinone reductase-like Zn-dependent oxidoreductase
MKNQAAYLLAPKQSPLEIRDAPYTSPKPNEIVVVSKAIAINPLDRIKQEVGNFLFGYLKYPIILGTDVAGDVVEVGSSVTRFKVGDRVVGQAIGLAEARNRSAESGFQKYVVLQEFMVAPLPPSLEYEKAVVLPLALGTAACALFQKGQLGLQHPTSPSREPTGKTVLIWGAGTSVGVNAVQLAVASGYSVFATCSSRSASVVESLGAERTFDYKSPTAVADIIAAFKGRKCAGVASCAGANAGAKACMDVLASVEGDRNLSVVSFPTPEIWSLPAVVWKMSSYMARKAVKSTLGGFTVKPFPIGDTLAEDEVGPAVWRDFVSVALQDGSYKCAPEPHVVGQGLEKVQKAIDMQKEIGAKGKKAVVLLR